MSRGYSAPRSGDEHEDLTENFCTRNENVDQLKKLLEVEKAKK
jgi:hypothetical protein